MDSKNRSKTTRGGKREGAGRHNKFGEVTTTIAVRVPASRVDEIKLLINKILKRYENSPR